MGIVKIIGIVLLVLGVVALIFGAYNLISYSTSTGGKMANKAAGFFGTRTKAVQNSIIWMAVGAGSAVVGFILYKKR